MVIIVVVIIAQTADMARRYHIPVALGNHMSSRAERRRARSSDLTSIMQIRQGNSTKVCRLQLVPRLRALRRSARDDNSAPYGAPLGMTIMAYLSCRAGISKRSTSLRIAVRAKPTSAIMMRPTYMVFTERICQAFQIM